MEPQEIWQLVYDRELPKARELWLDKLLAEEFPAKPPNFQFQEGVSLDENYQAMELRDRERVSWEASWGMQTWSNRRARDIADKAAARGTEEPWRHIRDRIYQRDHGICDICQTWVHPDHYHCGHIIDRVMGGADLDDNLVVMCNVCNVVLKPLHASREEYEAWKVSLNGNYHPWYNEVLKHLDE